MKKHLLTDKTIHWQLAVSPFVSKESRWSKILETCDSLDQFLNTVQETSRSGTTKYSTHFHDLVLNLADANPPFHHFANVQKYVKLITESLKFNDIKITEDDALAVKNRISMILQRDILCSLLGEDELTVWDGPQNLLDATPM